jgi:hypothetical protein
VSTTSLPSHPPLLPCVADFRRPLRAFFIIALFACALPPATEAQWGMIDDILRTGSRVARVPGPVDLARAVRTGIRGSQPLSGAARVASGLAAPDAARAVLGALPESLTPPYYLSWENGNAHLISRTGEASTTSARTLRQSLAALPGPDEGRRILVVEEEVLRNQELVSAIAAEPDVSVSLASIDGPPIPAVVLDTGKGYEVLLELYSGLRIPMTDAEGIQALHTLALFPFSPRDLSFGILLDDVAARDEISALGRILGGRAASQVVSGEAQLEQVFRRANGKVVALISHIEQRNGAAHAVVYNASSQPVLAVPVSRIEALAREHRAPLLMLGCRSALVSGAAGYSAVIRTGRLVPDIANALDATDWTTFFGGLGRTNAFVVRSETVDGVTTLILQRSDDRAVPGGLASVTVGGSLAVRAQGYSAKTIAALPLWWNRLIDAGVVVLVLGLVVSFFTHSGTVLKYSLGAALAIPLLPVAVVVFAVLFVIGLFLPPEDKAQAEAPTPATQA